MSNHFNRWDGGQIVPKNIYKTSSLGIFDIKKKKKKILLLKRELENIDIKKTKQKKTKKKKKKKKQTNKQNKNVSKQIFIISFY